MTDLEKEIKLLSDELKKALSTKLDESDAEVKALLNRIDTIEKRMDSGLENTDDGFGGFGGGKSIGEALINHEQYKNFKSAGYARSGKIPVESFERKAALTREQYPVAADRYRVIAGAPHRRTHVRELFQTIPTSSNLIEFVRKTGETNAAAPQKGEGVLKAESAMNFGLVSRPVETLAHWLPCSKQLMDDDVMLAAFINNQALEMLRIHEERQLLGGDGSDHSLFGLITEAAAFDASVNASSDIPPDTLRKAACQVGCADYRPDFIILNPRDWTKIDLIRESTTLGGGYILAKARSAAGLWNMAEIESTALAPGYFLVGDSSGAIIFDRQQAAIEISREHADFFTRNMAAILCEERLALCVLDQKSLVYGAFPN